MILKNLFNTIIFENVLDLNLKEIEDFSLNLKNVSPGRKLSNFGGWQSEMFNRHVEVDCLKKLVNTIDQNLNVVSTKAGFKTPVSLDVFWININEKNNFNKPHIHPDSIFSGAFYVKTSKNCGNICFENPNFAQQYVIEPDDVQSWNSFNSPNRSYFPDDNLLLIFPSWISHYVEPNQSDCTRISISFNSTFL
jgi:uncharacterized protein (TIGR02466 family)